MATAFFSQFDALAGPNGTWIKPGGRVAAYVRSTGAQEGDDLFATSGNLVSTIAAGVARCRPGQNDIVFVLTGHTETITGSLFTAVAGAQIIGCGVQGSSNAPNVTLSGTGAGIALSAANMTIAGLNINSATAAVTGAIVVTAAGVTLANNFISFSGALGANPAVQVGAGAANFTMEDNVLVVSSTAGIVNVSNAQALNFMIRRNYLRQLVSGVYVNVANVAASGVLASNYGKAVGAAPTGNDGFVIGAAAVTLVGNFENYVAANTAAAGLLADGT